jgi:hypothetical protein
MNGNINMDSRIAGSMNDNMDSRIAGSMNGNINMDSRIAGSMNDNINMYNTIAGLITVCYNVARKVCPLGTPRMFRRSTLSSLSSTFLYVTLGIE